MELGHGMDHKGNNLEHHTCSVPFLKLHRAWPNTTPVTQPDTHTHTHTHTHIRTHTHTHTHTKEHTHTPCLTERYTHTHTHTPSHTHTHTHTHTHKHTHTHTHTHHAGWLICALNPNPLTTLSSALAHASQGCAIFSELR